LVVVVELFIFLILKKDTNFVKKFRYYLFGETGNAFTSVFMFFSAVALTFYSALTLKINEELLKSFWVAGALGGITLACAIVFISRKQVPGSKNKTTFFGLLAFSLVLPFFSTTYIDALLKSTFERYGIRQSNVTLLLSKENYKTITKLVSQAPSGFSNCDAVEPFVIHRSTTLWHGLGERSLVKIPIRSVSIFEKETDTKGKSVNVEVELEKKGLQIARGNQLTDSCISFSIKGFAAGRSEFTSQSNQDFEEAVDILKSIKVDITQIEVVGFADPRRIETGNYELSYLRAATVKKRLLAVDKFKNVAFRSVKGEGVLIVKNDCTENLDLKIRNECFASHRRTEVRVFFNTNIATNSKVELKSK
jgi:outer membrane protein OmpA-like peptidoglycan-associated protein